MVGAILTGAKIAGSLLGNLLNKKQQSNSNSAALPGNTPIQADSIALGPSAISKAPAANVMPNVLQNGLSMAAPLMAKVGAPAINGLGGIAKSLLSTLNDDEWFEHYDGNGATFNELLKAEISASTSASASVRTFGGMAVIAIDLCRTADFWNSFMPQVLAYTRKKTNNILQDDTTKYQLAFACIWKLYEIYYTLEKYYNFMLKTPSNAPTIISAFKLFKPQNVNQTRGVIDSLKAYLQSTAKLPYALCSYIRWRFGTIFLSSNTKRAGFISYDAYTQNYPAAVAANGTLNVSTAGAGKAISPDGGLAQMTPTELSTMIDSIKTVLTTCGRAAADLATAYENHVVKWDVEDRHFDEKEFCLRQNSNAGRFYVEDMNGNAIGDRSVSLLLDSRVDMNAGIQAVTISISPSIFSALAAFQGVDTAPFPIAGEVVLFDATELYAKFSSLNFDVVTDGVISIDQFGRVDSASKWLWTMTTKTVIDSNASYTVTQWKSAIARAISMTIQNSLELHMYNSSEIRVGMSTATATEPTITLMSAPLSYDRANVSWESLHSIQRSAILNLVRGDYANKRAVDVKEEATELVNDLTSKDVTITDAEPKVK